MTGTSALHACHPQHSSTTARSLQVSSLRSRDLANRSLARVRSHPNFNRVPSLLGFHVVVAYARTIMKLCPYIQFLSHTFRVKPVNSLWFIEKNQRTRWNFRHDGGQIAGVLARNLRRYIRIKTKLPKRDNARNAVRRRWWQGHVSGENNASWSWFTRHW